MSLRSARKVLANNTNRLFLAYYYEAAFKLAVECNAPETAAQLYGYAARQRRNAKMPLQPSEEKPLKERAATLSRIFNREALRDMLLKGAALDASTIEGLIDTLGSAPEPSQDPA